MQGLCCVGFEIIILIVPSPVLPGSGSMGMISARNIKAPHNEISVAKVGIFYKTMHNKC